MNKTLHKIHLWLSIPLGLIITVICFTGATLVFEQDITRALNKGYHTCPKQESLSGGSASGKRKTCSFRSHKYRTGQTRRNEEASLKLQMLHIR